MPNYLAEFDAYNYARSFSGLLRYRQLLAESKPCQSDSTWRAMAIES